MDEEVASHFPKRATYVSLTSTDTAFKAKDQYGMDYELQAVDLIYRHGGKAVLLKPSGEKIYDAEANMRFNMLPRMEITGSGYDKVYTPPAKSKLEDFTRFKKFDTKNSDWAPKTSVYIINNEYISRPISRGRVKSLE